MMMLGLILALIGGAVAYGYSTVLGAILFLVGAALLARGYLTPEPAPEPPRNHVAAGSITYNIPSSKPK